MARKSKEVESQDLGQPAEQVAPKPRTYTRSGELSVKVSARVAKIVKALAERYSKKQGEILAELGARLDAGFVDNLRAMAADYEAARVANIADLFEVHVEPEVPAEEVPSDEFPVAINDEFGEGE